MSRTNIVDLLRKIAVFADVGDNRNPSQNGDDAIIADWQTMKGTHAIKARITLGDARIAREFVDKVDAAKTKTEHIILRKAAFGDFPT